MATTPEDYKYVAEDRSMRAARFADEIAKLVGVSGMRVLDVGCHRGEISCALSERHGCDVVGVDIDSYSDWVVHKPERVSFIAADISKPHASLEENSFDRIVSVSVWEHIRHPWSALKQCARYLKPDGKFYLFSMLYRSAGASHLMHRLEEKWPHLLFAPEDIRKMLNTSELGSSFWCNKLTYQQYLLYFRKLGFHITYERFNRDMFSEKTFAKYVDRLDLYPMWDLRTDFFRVVLEFDQIKPKAPIKDPVYRLS